MNSSDYNTITAAVRVLLGINEWDLAPRLARVADRMREGAYDHLNDLPGPDVYSAQEGNPVRHTAGLRGQRFPACPSSLHGIDGSGCPAPKVIPDQNPPAWADE